MWHDPRLLNRAAAWLFLATGLATAIVATRALTEGLFPFREVTVVGAHRPETRQALRQVVHALKGGFFTLDLEAARQAFERLPWVRQATVRRLWPNRLLVELEEHVPAASWNGQRILSVRGELFAVQPWEALPRVHAPEGSERQVARQLARFQKLVHPAGWRIASLQVSPRGAWRMTLLPASTQRAQALGGEAHALRVSLELGRDRLEERVRRFVTFYDAAIARLGPITQIDLRYPNGFAIRRQATADRGQKNPLSAGASCLSSDPCSWNPVT